MSKMLCIARREYIAAVRTKAFVLSIVLVPVFMFGTIIMSKVLKGQVDTSDKRVAIVDRSGALAEHIIAAAKERNETKITDENGKKVKPAYLFEIVPPNNDDPLAQQVELSKRVEKKELHAFLEIGKDVVYPVYPKEDSPETTQVPETSQVIYHAESAALDDLRKWLRGPLNDEIFNLRLAQANIDKNIVERIVQHADVQALGLVTVDETTGLVTEASKSNEVTAIIVPMVMMMMMFMLIMMGAQPLMQSVLEEKTLRIAEVILGSVSPFQLMMGKLLGSIAVSLTVVGVYVLGGAFVADRMSVADYVPYHILPWFVAYQVAAIFMFGALYIAVGSACSDLKEAQSLMMPVMMFVMIPLFVWIHVVKQPLSNFSTYLSLFPPCTPMLMLIRQATPTGVPAWQPWAGLGGVVVATLASVWAAGRIFRVAILMQGKPPKISDLIRWAIRG